ncbi:hypothetical protein DERP_010227 [Dermatophagoides pteronyssinus]|uniref:Uncharacterized protein n=1 Tax=Dermatophagoides pteronyssinus TaxID=6956 RepID=A0ABQ8J6Z0_DERPT|nr:hypothetical protein DERP_010227 [Dermatophagoides pteronyssinus]
MPAAFDEELFKILSCELAIVVIMPNSCCCDINNQIEYHEYYQCYYDCYGFFHFQAEKKQS